MFNLNVITNENNTEHNVKWSYIQDHPYRILIIRNSGSGKTNALLNFIWLFTDKIYLYCKDLNEPKYQLSIKKREEVGMCLDDQNPKPFLKCSNTVDDFYNNTDDCNPHRRRKILIVFDDMMADVNTNKKF